MPKIDIAGEYLDGKLFFHRYDIIGQNKTPTIKVVCQNVQGQEAWGDLWCSEKAMDKTIELLRALGVQGASGREVLMNAEKQLEGVDVDFEVEQNGDYFNVSRIKPAGSDGYAGGGGRGVSQQSFLDRVLAVHGGGAKPAQPAPAPAPTTDDDNLPF